VPETGRLPAGQQLAPRARRAHTGRPGRASEARDWLRSPQARAQDDKPGRPLALVPPVAPAPRDRLRSAKQP
jgi:hypothetical protein